jgi:hypothetical protein
VKHDLRTPADARSDAGFSLTEALISSVILLVLFGTSITSLRQTTELSRTVGNRNEMHASVRGATELLQQEIGQAGRVALPGPIALGGAVAAEGINTVAVTTSNGLFIGAQVIIGTGQEAETVTLTDVTPASITADFEELHDSGDPVTILGGFTSGVVPPSMTNGSTGNVLKIYGDINDDGQMVYAEYTCNFATNNLYRNVVAWNAASKPAVTEEMVLLNNVIVNPGNAPCFTYQTEIVNGNTYVTGVAVTLSVRSQQIDVHFKQRLEATKTLLNVSPRNIFLVWSMASVGVTNRLQPMPPTITNLIQ